ncbi:MAG: glycosyltransferase family 2 protein [Candidatus Omnitrophica bacterium]|nr:glycosyltransferase family 2 protein [Candidatus Omnitrophota bacterium]MDD5545945.1 glycosyltransferase family 2 protein [Candidatus Omnitrophota bacterium]
MEIRCDLVLLSWNNLAILKRCVESLMRCTGVASRLIVVDNGSTEKGIREFLSEIKDGPNVRVEVIFNRLNEGFPRGMNKGMERSRAPYVCLLNNDIIATEGWLDEMIRVAGSDPSVGMVNPSSNNFGLRFGKDTTLEEFSRGFVEHSGEWIEMNACVGFCMLIKREVIEKIGFLDDKFGYAYFEDTDYSRRAQAAGFKCVMANGCYVYHEEGKSGKFLKDKDDTFDRSARIFEKRWGRILRVAFIVTEREAVSMEKAAQEIREELVGHNRVWLFAGKGVDLSSLPKHLDLMNDSPKNFFKLKSFWNIIIRKKRFDRIYTGDPVLRGALAGYRFFRGAEIREI